jgi:uncharacterized protein YxjI
MNVDQNQSRQRDNTMTHNTYLTKVILAIGLLLCLSGCGDKIDKDPARSLPNHFSMEERLFFKWGNTLDVTKNGVNYGTVSKNPISLTTTFNYDDNTGARAATASVAFLSWGTQIDVSDAGGRRIGTIKEEVLYSLFKTWTTYIILDANGNQVAISEKTDFFATTFNLTGNDGHAIATIHRPAFNWFGDNWDVTIQDNSTVDPRLVLMIPAFKTSADNAKKSSNSSSSSSKSKK